MGQVEEPEQRLNLLQRQDATTVTHLQLSREKVVSKWEGGKKKVMLLCAVISEGQAQQLCPFDLIKPALRH